MATVDIPKDPDQYSLWHSTQATTNISKYKNPRIDKLLEIELSLIKIQGKNIFRFSKILVEDVPAIFLYHPPSTQSSINLIILLILSIS